MYLKDLMATKFVVLVLHMLAVCISMYARDTNVYTGLTLGQEISASEVDMIRRG
jgi:hypothetical protein